MTTRQLPIVFGQTDYLQQLGTTGGSIAQFGCYVTSFATLAKACGKDTDPIELNKAFIAQNLYINGNLMADNNLSKVFPDLVYQRSIEYAGNVTSNGKAGTAGTFDINTLRDLMNDDSTWVIIKIAVPAPYNTHFVLCAGVNGVIKIADPMTKTIIDFSTRYGDPEKTILKLVVYKGTPAVQMQVDDSARIERDINWNVAQEVVSHLGIEVTPNDKEGMVRRAKEKIDSYISQVSQYRGAVKELTNKYEAASESILALKKEIEEIHKQDRNYGQEALDAQRLANERQTYLHHIAEVMDINYDPTNDKQLVEDVLKQIALQQKQQHPDESRLQTIVQFFITMGINNYLSGRNIAPIDPSKADPDLEEKIRLYLTALAEELLTKSQTPEQDHQTTLIDPSNMSQGSFITRLFTRLISVFVEVR